MIPFLLQLNVSYTLVFPLAGFQEITAKALIGICIAIVS